MNNTLSSSSLVLASGNAGKIREFQALLPQYTLLTQNHFAVPDVAETGLTFVENALLKARNAARYAQLPALADDSGLVVHALNDAPGIYSARYAGQGADDAQNIDKLLHALEGVPTHDRHAYFFCVLVFLRHAEDPCPFIAQGRWDGVILTQAKGEFGFGYDPIFGVPSHHCSAAQLPPAIKNSLSHRAKALDQLKTLLTSNTALRV
ncbi:MAG TPA: non-canonical purine NTP pyrophosphatase, RdgB/HAM1 family [Methylococcaceae bacterium]|nr:non-canonical purine NTP pyrophosphatase, RdgB/HAM1 family [Methylococcaceae bacterium]